MSGTTMVNKEKSKVNKLKAMAYNHNLVKPDTENPHHVAFNCGHFARL